MNLNPKIFPFSASDTYLAIAPHEENDWHRVHPGGLFLRTVRTQSEVPFVALLTPILKDGSSIEFVEYSMTPECFSAKTANGIIRFAFANDTTVVVQADSAELGLRLDFVSKGLMSQFLFPIPRPGQKEADGSLILANANKNRARFLLNSKAGRFIPADPLWDGRCSDNMCVEIYPEASSKPISFSIKEYLGEWDGVAEDFDFDTACQTQAESFKKFLDAMPEVATEFEQTRKQAAYLLWSCTVKKSGLLKRDVILMSKNWMDRVWSWDHCFNAMALADGLPEKAWDQLLAPFDLQGEDGSLPDFISEGRTLRGYVKPPIHGWTLGKLIEKIKPTKEQLQEAYERISRWTMWWVNYRDRNGNGLCEYDHGNDSGWDNSTAFLDLPPTETPDIAAFLSIQAEELAAVAEQLGKDSAEVQGWKDLAKQQISAMLTELFDEEGRPYARQAYTGKKTSPDTLLLRVPAILGDRLPEKVRASLVADLTSDKFLTEWGYATESPASSYYVCDGYWRGPIWAPSTMIIYEALCNCGEEKLAKHIATRFCEMCAKSGFAENFNAQTGEGLRDRAYTWTASVFLVLASKLR